jgi:hypothetical protein
MKIQPGLVDNYSFPSNDKDGAYVEDCFFTSSEIIHEKNRLYKKELKRLYPQLKWWQIRPWLEATFKNLLPLTKSETFKQ